MIKRFSGISLLFLSMSLFNLAVADTGAQEAITKSLSSIFPGITPDKISPSPMAGVSEVLIGPRLMYVSNDGKYLLQGSLIDLKTRVDIGEERRNGIRLDALNDLGEDKMIVFPAKEQKHVITVFTDIDCGYCRKLHDEMDKYNAEGITVRYLMFPRAGIDSPSYKKAVTVWCDKDPQNAMTRAKSGEKRVRAWTIDWCPWYPGDHYGRWCHVAGLCSCCPIGQGAGSRFLILYGATTPIGIADAIRSYRFIY
jgi:thiol:disulfide interchange protein DsbC